MESAEIIGFILKYFNFEQLCIAERINSNFKYCVSLELALVKYILISAKFLRIRKIIDEFSLNRTEEETLNLMKNILIPHKTLTKLKISCDDHWINLPQCRNLKFLHINIGRDFTASEYRSLYEFLSNNDKIETLSIWNICPDEVLISKLSLLPNLKEFEFGIWFDFDVSIFQYHKADHIRQLKKVEKISVSFPEISKVETEFVCALLAHCPNLIHFDLHSTNQIESFRIDYLDSGNDSHDEDDDFYQDKELLFKMINLKELFVINYVTMPDVQNISILKKLDLLHLVLKNMDDIKRARKISFPDSLKSLHIYITGVPCSSSTDKAFSKLIDVVLDRCPNLSSFSTGNLSKTQLRKVPVKWPNLKSLSIEQLGTINKEFYTVEDFEYVVENMPNLHILK
uniref:F-box domain-containing protein n=1 Tax=Romanomermis culicivorax TaxID=13658 RepID=A0A915HS24_ROMCU